MKISFCISIFSIVIVCFLPRDCDGRSEVKKTTVGEKAFIARQDSLLSSESLRSLAELLLKHSRWHFVSSEDSMEVEKQTLFQGRYAGSGWPWLVSVDTARMGQSKAVRALRSLVVDLTGNEDYELEHGFGVLLRRGDETRMTAGYHALTSPDISGSSMASAEAVNVFVELTAPPWQKNDYGETLFYSPQGHATTSGVREVLEGVHLRHGRVLAWTDDIPFSLRPPSMNQEKTRCGLLLRFVAEEMEDKAAGKYQKSGQPEGQTCDLELLSALSSGSVVDSSALNPVRQFTDADGKAVAVYDQVLSAEDLLKLRQHWLSSCSTFQYQFDDGMLGGMNHKETQKSLPWLVEISGVEFAKTSFWTALRKLVAVTSGKDSWFPYEVSVAALRSADTVPSVANDPEDENGEYSILLFLDETGASHSHGGLLFYERGKAESLDSEEDSEEGHVEEEGSLSSLDENQGMKIPSQEPFYDTFGSVRPRPGRIAVFNSATLYSLRPPTTDYKGIHTVLKVKLAPTERLGKAKMLVKILDQCMAAGDHKVQDRRNALQLLLLENAKARRAEASATDESLPSVASLDSDLAEYHTQLASLKAAALQSLYLKL